jgi:hypothetical protein
VAIAMGLDQDDDIDDHPPIGGRSARTADRDVVDS